MLKIGITGGIGSGKSTLIRHFADSGVPRYDSDSRAKVLMNSDREIKSAITELLGTDAYDSFGELNRGFVAERIFGDDTLRVALNAIVHPAVLRDLEEWSLRQGDVAYVVVESAILFDAGFDSSVDLSVAVLAPETMRVERVVSRDGVFEEQVRARIAAQMSDDELHSRADFSVVNIFEEDLEGAAQRLDQIFKQEALKRERNV